MSTLPLGKILARLPSGVQSRDLTPDEIARYITDQYIKAPTEKARRKMHKRRRELYHDAGTEHMRALIQSVFKRLPVIELRTIWAEYARFANPIRRIVNELSTVYQEPAIREVAGVEDNKRYQLVQRKCRQHEQARRVNRMLNLHRALFVGYRVRDLTTPEQREPVIDIVTPDRCDAITHPNDPTKIIALRIDVHYRPARPTRQIPAHLVWTDHERFQLTAEGGFIPSSYKEHGLGRMPWHFMSLEPPDATVWPGEVGEDLVAAHLAIWFANVCLLKETKSATKLPIVTGDAARAARDQAADSEFPVEVPEGTSVSNLDQAMDLELFQDAGEHIYDNAAGDYGISSGLRKHQGVQSAEARELMRVPVQELRREQMIVFDDFEHDFVQIQSLVNRRDLEELAFSPDGHNVRYGEVRTPLGAKETLEVFETERRLGLTNTVRFLRDRYGLSEEQAWALLEENVGTELARAVLQRPLEAVNGAAGAPADGPQATAQQNGAKGQAAGGSPPGQQKPAGGRDLAAIARAALKEAA